MKSPSLYIKKGIIYFKEPYKVNALSFAYQHSGCDAICVDDTTYSKEKRIVCYASNESYNDLLKEIFIAEYKGKGYKLLVGIASEGMVL